MKTFLRSLSAVLLLLALSTGAFAATITVSGTLVAVPTTYGTASSNTTFTVSGTTLTAGITVAAPAGYEVSTSSGGPFAASILVGSAPTVLSTTIYVRIAAATVPGSYSGNVTCSSTGAVSKTVATVASTVSKAVLTISGLSGVNKVYDRTTTATLSGSGSLVGIIGADVVTLTGTPSPTFASANVGIGIAITVTGYTLGGANAGNYTLTQPTGLTANITAKTLTVSGVSASNKSYNGNTTATVSGGVLTGIISPDVVTVSTTGTFASANVANGIVVTVALAGANAGNYTLTQPGITANITTAALTITANDVSKVYGTTITGGTGSVAFTNSALLNGETIGTVSIAYGTGSAATAAVASYVGQVTPSAATGGTFNPANYNITYITGKITVTPATLTIINLSGVNKVYDRTTTATLSGSAALSGILNSDVVILGGTPVANFPSKNVGTGLAITVSGYTISGAGSGNYTLTQPTGLTANITVASLTITSAAASNKVYDGTTAATITGTLSGIIGADVVTLVGTGTFATKNVGTAIAVTSTSTLGGADGGNYVVLPQPSGLTANITVKTLTITGISASNKIYDGTTTGSLTGSAALNGVVGADVVVLGGAGTATFSSKNVASGIAVTVSGYSISGTDAGNYSLTQPAGLTANITAATLVIQAIGPTKTTGNTSPVITGSTTNFIYYGNVNGETVTSVTLTPSPTTSQAAGATYTVTPSAAAGAGGFSTSNYSITYTAYNGVCSGHVYTWTGNNSTTWSSSNNWSPSTGTPTSTDDVVIPGSTARAPTVTASTSVNTIAFTGNNTITINSGFNLTTNNGFTVNSGVTAANVNFVGASTSTVLEFSSSIFANYGTFNLSGTGLFQIDNNGSYIYNSGTFTANNNTTLYLQGGSNVTHALTNAGTFYAGTSGSPCFIEMDDYGSIENSGTFKLGPTSLMYFYNDNAQFVNIHNLSGGTFTLQSDATGSASIGEVPQGKNNLFIGNFNVERYYKGSNTYSGGRWVERAYRIISSCVNTGSLVNGNYVFGLNYIVGGTAGQTTAANSLTNSFITGCTGGSTSGGNPSIYLYNESYTPSNATYVSGNFLGITNITNSSTGGTITASDGGSYSMPVGTGVLFFFRGAATNWSTRTVYPYIAPENVTLTSVGNMNSGAYTFKDWFTPASSNLAYTGSGGGGNAAVRGFNMIGNPYPCAIDWLNFYTAANGNARTNLSTTIWVFNPVTYQYDTYQATSSSTGVATGNASRYIASGQGFIVQGTAASPALTISEYAKVVLNANGTVGTGTIPAAAQLTGANLLMTRALPQDQIDRSLRLKLEVDSLNYDDIFIGFNPSASVGYNPYEDSRYLAGMAAAEGLSSMTSDNVPVSINYLPFPKQTAQVIKLYVTGKTSGTYNLLQTSLKSIPQIYDLWLIDKYKKDSVNLRTQTKYTFKINLADTNSYGSNRFSVVIRQNPTLALKLLTFTGKKTGDGSLVSWSTKNEENYTNFTVERSTNNGARYTIVGGLAGSGVGQYSLVDKNPQLSVNLYRLRMEDLNGNISYSSPFTLIYGNNGDVESNPVTLYPNPTRSTINLTINPVYAGGRNVVQAISGRLNAGIAGSSFYNIRIMNASGLIIKNESTKTNTWQADVKNLLPGTYVMQVYDGSNNSLVGKGTFVKM